MTSSSGSPRAMVDQQPLRGLARFHAAGAFRSSGKEAEPELTSEAQVALYLADPVG